MNNVIHTLIKALSAKRPISPRQWIVEGVAARGFVTSLIADRGVGKTQLLASLALAVATDRGSIVGMSVSERTRVWYWNQEAEIAEIHRRFSAVLIKHALDYRAFASAFFLNSGVRSSFNLAVCGKDLHKFIQEVRERNIGLVILDGFSESSDEEGQAFWEAARTIALHGNCAVIVPSPRGGGEAQVNAPSLVFTLTAMGDAEAKKAGIKNRRSWVRLDCVKSNLGPLNTTPRWFFHAPINVGPYDDPDFASCLMPRAAANLCVRRAIATLRAYL